MLIPVKVGLLGRDGQALPLQPEGNIRVTDGAALLIMDSPRQTFVFHNVDQDPVPSLLRDFSAPVKLEYPYSDDELAVLMAHDTNEFVRWEAAQMLAQNVILENVKRRAKGDAMQVEVVLADAFRSLVQDDSVDPALIAQAITLPDEAYLAEAMEVVDVDGIHEARSFVRAQLAAGAEGILRNRYRELGAAGPYANSASEIARRSLRNALLSYLVNTEQGFSLAEAQLAGSDNMTDTLAALKSLAWYGAPSAGAAMADFERRWRDDPLVLDKWFAIQAAAPGPATVGRVKALMDHPAFSMRNPNKVRALLGTLAAANPTAFHARDGSGYRLLADQVLTLDELNPQVAARLAGAFNRWTRYDEKRRRLMREEIARIDGGASLSPNVAEIVGNALQMSDPEDC